MSKHPQGILSNTGCNYESLTYSTGPYAICKVYFWETFEERKDIL